MSASKAEGSIYLGPIRNHYKIIDPESGKKKLDSIENLGIVDRISENVTKVYESMKKDPDRVEAFFDGLNSMVNEFSANKINTRNYANRIADMIVSHQKRRAEILAYACYLAVTDTSLDQKEREKAKYFLGEVDYGSNIGPDGAIKRPSFWKAPAKTMSTRVSTWYRKLLDYSEKVTV
jgi:hypothetical protein